MEKEKLLRFVIILILLIANAYAKALDDLIKSQELVVKKHLPETQEFIEQAKHNILKYQLDAEKIINNSKANCRLDPKLDWLKDLNLQKPKGSDLSKELYIFGSLSMPKSRLINLIQEATHYNALVVLRGLKNNSYKETAKFLQAIIKEGGAGFIIDPNLFREYKVAKVPVFVLNDPLTKKYDQITGNISLKYALEEFAKHGDLKKEASQILGVSK